MRAEFDHISRAGGLFTLVDLRSGCGVGVAAGLSSDVVSGVAPGGVSVRVMAGVGVAGESGVCKMGGRGVETPGSVLVGDVVEGESSIGLCRGVGGGLGLLGGMVASSGGGPGGRWAISSRMDLLLAGLYIGKNFLRNFLFLSVCLPGPSILTRYWWYWRTSMTTPVRSHLCGWRPVWFWILTLSPTFSGERALVCSLHLSWWSM